MYNYRIDKVKLLAALSVVSVHVTAFMVADELATTANYYWYRYLFNFAVPFFFATTGYLIASHSQRYLARYIKKTLILYLVLSIFYLVVDGVMFTLTRMGLGDSFSVSASGYIHSKNWTDLLNGSFAQYHLWYLWALVIALVLIYYGLQLKLNARALLFLSALLYLGSLYFISQNRLNELLANGGFPKAMFAIMIGYWIGIKGKRHAWGLIGFFTFVGIYIFLSLSSNSIFWSELFLLISIYYLMLYVNASEGQASSWSKLGKDSLSIYLLHPVILFGYNYMIQLVPRLAIENPWLRIIILFSASLAGSLLLYPLVNRYYLQPAEQFITNITTPKHARP